MPKRRKYTPKRLRDRRSGQSPYQRYSKRPYKYPAYQSLYRDTVAEPAPDREEKLT